MNRKIYKAIAKKHGISVEEVKREMQKAVDAAYVFPSAEAESVPRAGEKPTIEEFIDYSVKKIKGG